MSQDLESWLLQSFGLSLDCYPTAFAERVQAQYAQLSPSQWERQRSEIARSLSIPETHFGRHPACFEAAEEVLSGLLGRRFASVRLWSAGCATGEEAYNLAAMARSVFGDRVQVIGTDFSTAAVEKARIGHYRKWSMRGVDPDKVPWLIPDDEGVSVDPALKKLVRFEVATLVAPPPKNMDVVFCRNVLIYFSPQGADRVMRRLSEALRPEGVLFMAPTDPVPQELGRWDKISHAGAPVRMYHPPERAYREDPEPANTLGADLAGTIRSMLKR